MLELSHMDINHSAIENKALDVLDQFNITEPVVNAVEIAEKSGIGVKEARMPEKYSNVAGFYDKNDNVIYVNKEDPPTRKLFTVAHELGHIFLKHENFNVLFRITKKDTPEPSYPKEEREANSFAAHLLMPDFMLREYLDKYNLTKNDYVQMANIFGVPISAMKPMLEYLD